MTQLTDMPDAVDSAHQRKTLRRGSRAMTTAAGSDAVEARSHLHALGVTTVIAAILGAASAIGVWMLMFATLGASLVRADPGWSR